MKKRKLVAIRGTPYVTRAVYKLHAVYLLILSDGTTRWEVIGRAFSNLPIGVQLFRSKQKIKKHAPAVNFHLSWSQLQSGERIHAV